MVDIYPSLVVRKDIPEEELENNRLLRRCRGRKICYFNGYHLSGKIQVNKDLYDDYAWVSRHELPKYLDEDQYKEIVHATSFD